MLAALGLTGEAPSPTFAIVQFYEPPEVRLAVLHVDLYRLDGPSAMEELGLDDAAADAVLVVEWPDRAGAGAWPDALRLRLAAEGGGRRLTWEVPAAWAGRWPT
jgi:tRNA threonylcarbamoyladenosine biosynthesis protein TsaE